MRGLALDAWDESFGVLLKERGASTWGLDSSPFWAVEDHIFPVRGYQDCRTVLSHPHLLSQMDNRSLRQSDSNLVFLEGDVHKRLRSVVARSLPDWRLAVASSRQFVDGLLERLPADVQLDIVGDFAVPIAEDMSIIILGLPQDEHGHLAPLLSAMSAQFDPASGPGELDAATEAVHEFLSLIRTTVRTKTYSPGGGLDLLNRARRAGNLSLRDMLGSSMMLAHASFQNSVNALSFAAVESMTNPALGEVLRTAGAAGQRAAVEEVLRLGSPARFLGRRADAAVTIGSGQIAERDLVIPFVATANRDPTVFDNPDQFVPFRESPGHLAFGAGAHLCLGATLARGEMLAAVEGLTAKYRELTFDSATWGTNMVMFGPTSFVVGLGGTPSGPRPIGQPRKETGSASIPRRTTLAL